MTTETPDVESYQKQPLKPKSIWKELSYAEIAVILLGIGYFVYLNLSTSLVPNLNTENQTRIINGMPNPPNTVLYRPNDYVPQSNVSNTQAFFGGAIIILIALVFLSKRVNIPRRATIQEALEDVSKQIMKLKNIDGQTVRIYPTKDGIKIITELEEIELSNKFLTRYKTVEGKRWAFRYTIHTTITEKNGIPEYYKVYYHPWSRYWDGFVPTKKHLSDEDRCPDCGTDYDEKIVTGADLIAWKKAKLGVGERVVP